MLLTACSWFFSPSCLVLGMPVVGLSVFLLRVRLFDLLCSE
ncbi:hypothetical protein NRI_0457 [Neorickettsia risticii str. Illinois]|uniref:Uncharacterized protein n=1 Tax=Neorickettsia risticii (strain Illinois) TaxID=434131 RepID=C6V4X2_NEORI|nr:hypothetical protein NRI_0457 [Neorickettsia risticii str. Illinois]